LATLEQPKSSLLEDDALGVQVAKTAPKSVIGKTLTTYQSTFVGDAAEGGFKQSLHFLRCTGDSGLHVR
jgi:hypothetical protein